MFISIGFSLAVAMGLILGLIGSGGSMLTVPILVYLFGLKPFIATGYSLLVVGSTAAVGTFSYWRRGLIRARDTIVFVIPSTIMILVTRRFIVPSLPDPLLTLCGFPVPKGVFIMLIFAALMLFAGWLMLKPLKVAPSQQSSYAPIVMMKLIFGSGVVGFLSGLVGAGGGFLITPVLITWFNLSMKEAIATSLAVIMLNSLVGFQGDLLAGIMIDWHILGPFLALAILGMLLGIRFNRHVDGALLKRFFGIFMLLLAGIILVTEFFVLFH